MQLGFGRGEAHIEHPRMLLLEEDVVGAIGLHALLGGRQRELLALVVAPLDCTRIEPTHSTVTKPHTRRRLAIETLMLKDRRHSRTKQPKQQRSSKAHTIDSRVR